MKTTLRKIIDNIDRSENSLQKTHVDWEALSEIFNINDLYWSDNERLKSYFFKKWYCTDTLVGAEAHFLDDKLVAISFQAARKSSKDFYFINKKSSNKLRNYLLSLLESNNDHHLQYVDDASLDEEIDSTFKINYNTQILQKTAFYQGELVDILKTHYDYNKFPDKHFHTVEIKKENGEVLEVDCRELNFEYNK
jgi:hypothetical protein